MQAYNAHQITLIECSLCYMRSRVIPIIETPIYHSSRFTAPFSAPPNCVVNQGFTLCSLYNQNNNTSNKQLLLHVNSVPISEKKIIFAVKSDAEKEDWNQNVIQAKQNVRLT